MHWGMTLDDVRMQSLNNQINKLRASVLTYRVISSGFPLLSVTFVVFLFSVLTDRVRDSQLVS